MNDHVPLFSMVALGTLAGCSGGTAAAPPASAVPPPALSAAAETGARIYNGNCIACHQPEARGVPGVYPSLVGSPVVLGDPGELALWVVKGRRPASMPQGRYPTMMQQFGWMKAPDAAALFTYLRSTFGNQAPPVPAAVVARALETQP